MTVLRKKLRNIINMKGAEVGIFQKRNSVTDREATEQD
jgi:hypothetical protein